MVTFPVRQRGSLVGFHLRQCGQVGISSQREIEHAMAKAAAARAIKGTETFPAKMTLEVAGLNLKIDFSGDITLQ